jgi:hypothetical protein
MSVTGIWNLHIATPVGAQSAILELTEAHGGIAGVMKNDRETLPVDDPVLDGSQLTWHVRMTRPLRLHLIFDVTVSGDTLSGTAKAGILPPSRVTGRQTSDNRPDTH